MKSFRDLEIYQMAYNLAIKVHKMTMQLPQYEMYEQGSQVRRSTKSIKDNIAEGTDVEGIKMILSGFWSMHMHRVMKHFLN